MWRSEAVSVARRTASGRWAMHRGGDPDENFDGGARGLGLAAPSGDRAALLLDSCLCSLVDVVKPLLVLLCDNELVLARLAADVSRRFGGDCTIIAESSPTRALARLVEAPDHPDERVAVLIIDEQMEEMTGLEFLARAHRQSR